MLSPKVLLLQIRKEQLVREEELSSFAHYTGIAKNQFDVLNVFDSPEFEPSVVEPYDAVFVGGASGTSVLQPYKFSFISYCLRLLVHCIDISKPVFASCYGFQLAVIALGGTIIRDPSPVELGTPLISVTEAGKSDPLFHNTPNPFYAISVHQEKALDLPDCCELLAYTDLCVHAFRVKQKPFWAVQFHPEVDNKILKERLGIYKSHYTKDEAHFEEVVSCIQATPDSHLLLKKFTHFIHKKEISKIK